MPKLMKTEHSERIKAALAAEIIRIQKERGWSRSRLAIDSGISQANFWTMVNGGENRLSIECLVGALHRLGYKVQVRVSPEVIG